MTEKYDGRDINVNRASKKFFPIIGKLEKAVNRYIQTGREEASTSSNKRGSYFLFYFRERGTRKIITYRADLFVMAIQSSVNESLMDSVDRVHLTRLRGLCMCSAISFGIIVSRWKTSFLCISELYRSHCFFEFRQAYLIHSNAKDK